MTRVSRAYFPWETLQVLLCECWSLSRVRLFATLWTVALQSPLSMGFPRQGYWSGLPFPSPVDLPDPGVEPTSPALQVDSLSQGSSFVSVSSSAIKSL